MRKDNIDIVSIETKAVKYDVKIIMTLAGPFRDDCIHAVGILVDGYYNHTFTFHGGRYFTHYNEETNTSSYGSHGSYSSDRKTITWSITKEKLGVKVLVEISLAQTLIYENYQNYVDIVNAGVEKSEEPMVAIDEESPEAVAGDDVIIYPWRIVTFDGWGSTDDVDVVSWTWTFQYNGSTVVLEGP